MGMGQNPGTPGEHQNSWDLWMFIPLKMVCIGIDPYPHVHMFSSCLLPLLGPQFLVTLYECLGWIKAIARLAGWAGASNAPVSDISR